MANKSSLSKMTKIQLIEHAEELEEKLSQRKIEEENGANVSKRETTDCSSELFDSIILQ